MSVHALALSASHEFSKTPVPQLTLLAGLGVEGDCHLGVTVQHLSRLRLTPPPPNLRQVHLIPKEILDECGVAPGQIGENVATSGIDLLALGKGTKLHFLPPLSPTSQFRNPHDGGDNGDGPDGDDNSDDEAALAAPHAIVVVQGVRNPCPQIDKFRAGLKERLIVRDGERRIVGRRAGVMGTVEAGGVVSVGMRIVVEEVEGGGFEKLECV
ncbi:pyruvate kinase-like protein [Parachaetomium inaequale]|uniref:Pyruvate kinase-like protein n=1 Tax=Parachaetomium inaequale TaxID=2588326 RepID=A0AAN6PFZ0_9PEZI|nr:pyruvate kinase-like protein [Parachaetomium inaequale]